MNLTFFFPGFTWFFFFPDLFTLPGNDLPHNDLFNIPFFDKYVHLTMFFMLTALFCYPFSYFDADHSFIKSWFNKIAVYVILYGILMEFVQKYFVYGRSFDVVD